MTVSLKRRWLIKIVEVVLRFGGEVALWSWHRPGVYCLSDVSFLSGGKITAFQSKQPYVTTLEQLKT